MLCYSHYYLPFRKILSYYRQFPFYATKRFNMVQDFSEGSRIIAFSSSHFPSLFLSFPFSLHRFAAFSIISFRSLLNCFILFNFFSFFFSPFLSLVSLLSLSFSPSFLSFLFSISSSLSHVLLSRSLFSLSFPFFLCFRVLSFYSIFLCTFSQLFHFILHISNEILLLLYYLIYDY